MNMLKSVAAATGLLCLLSAAHGQGYIAAIAEEAAAGEGLILGGRVVQTGRLHVGSANTLSVPGLHLSTNADI
ncbi:hypothetical protein OOZ63_15955 [Paucibacter sp. PLA-PC-4]|uniref:hypothetical protein n=1 Tax=Paucibacter sp. PLA-PC-4 TaxID=2993655 RepID=UPI0022497505|nr:hypothetical protein [Paucibacter sp. PLA-PC-4]MCX2863326.1 hypothetical protein [Paucibacter sp. PLA-PC-4]